jgi:formate dehydrogenase (coenzyme F420) beta subunit
MENELRAKAKELLAGGQVKMVIGYEAGSVPFKCTPLFAETPEDAERMVWNPACVNNLAVYLPQAVKRGKVAVVLKPCDMKSVVELVREHQIEREDVVAIVVSSPGMLDEDALSGIDLADIKSVAWRDGGIVVSTGGGEVTIPADKAFQEKCRRCSLGEPASADIKIGDFTAKTPAADTSVEEHEKLSPAERRAFWAGHFGRCIRCYACRQACPGCYCNECFVDKNGQVWASKATDATSNWFFHVTRAMHTAGRCIGCGECERACPMGIPLSLLGKKLEIDVEEMFGSAPGEDTEAAPVLGSFDANDPDPCPE